MSQYVLINRIKVQGANAIAGFTWGFPAITHFLGFSHNLSRKLSATENFNDINLSGCAVIAHNHHVHTYGSSYEVEFTQSRNSPYLHGLDNSQKNKTAPVIEEGKMNMTVSLLIECEGNVGNRQDGFIEWLTKHCFLQRLAGGTILDIGCVEIHGVNNDGEVRTLKRRLFPGFILQDRSDYLQKHYQDLLEKNANTELLDAWLDFTALKQKARPKSDLITKHLINIRKKQTDEQQGSRLVTVWDDHLKCPYQESEVPSDLIAYFDELENSKANNKLLNQWQSYCAPDESTDADWEYVRKPEAGYLVPIMMGYKAISEVYDNNEIENTRDSETSVCFVESAHSVGEWQSPHRIRSAEELSNCLWHYHYEKDWYLCKQNKPIFEDEKCEPEIITENLNDDFN
jgi:CRISPR-associated protein Csy2